MGQLSQGRSLEQAALRVLVIDDEPMIAKSIRRALGGVEVVAAHSGQEALGLLATQQPFDLLLCDLMMPDMNGMDVYQAIEQRSPELVERIVFMTGGTYISALDKFLERVNNRRLKKPFSADDIRQLVEASV